MTKLPETRPTKKPCQTPGCDWPVWHPCLVGKPDTFPQLLAAEAKNGTHFPQGRDTAYREQMSETMREHHASKRRRNPKLEAKIIDRYKQGGTGYKGVAQELGLGANFVFKVLKRAEAEGLLEMRKRGHTIAKGAK